MIDETWSISICKMYLGGSTLSNIALELGISMYDAKKRIRRVVESASKPKYFVQHSGKHLHLLPFTKMRKEKDEILARLENYQKDLLNGDWDNE